ncbi:hypothetical protein P8625_04605 [Tenacibaculum tangerinum]|uniref:Uncharacterized protein n=1 Tax=Tenacibaculum tangerinum TaxID=3038772 RepID=A0ABY8L592_9FLAO|nr:hypothetical protein [Tenacibaculum tangerinum]WGH76446.1 hypothetical protein P8625_04605 [Tenacibaculum tangerinum]
MNGKFNNLIQNEKFKELVFSNIIVSRPIPVSRFLEIYKLRKIGFEKKKLKTQVEELEYIIKSVESLSEKETQIVGVTIKFRETIIYYYNHDLTKFLGQLSRSLDDASIPE